MPQTGPRELSDRETDAEEWFIRCTPMVRFVERLLSHGIAFVVHYQLLLLLLMTFV